MSENNTDNKITELSDAEFLSFLYSERDRESSQSKYQGWNIWALFGAAATVICAGYYVLKENICSICPLQVMYFTSGILAFLLCYRPIINIISTVFGIKNSVDYQRVKTIKNIAPYFYLVFGMISSLTFSILVPLWDYDDPLNAVTISWFISFALFFCSLLSAIINKNKIVGSYYKELIFVKSKLEMFVRAAFGYNLSIVWIKSFDNINYSIIGNYDFELAVCISSAVFLAYLLMKVYWTEKATNDIDILIDEFLYMNSTKESVYSRLRINKMGHTALESCAKEIDEMYNSLQVFEKKMDDIEEIKQWFTQGKIDVDKIYECLDEIDKVMSYLDTFDKQTQALFKKLKQMEDAVPEIIDNDDFRRLHTILGAHVDRERKLLESTRLVANSMKQWKDKYYCNKYGGFCNKECEHRYDKPMLRLRWKRLCNMIKGNGIRKCSNNENNDPS